MLRSSTFTNDAIVATVSMSNDDIIIGKVSTHDNHTNMMAKFLIAKFDIA